MSAVPMELQHCPRCNSWGFGDGDVTYLPTIPARPALLFGLIPARAEVGARWAHRCVYCRYVTTRPAPDNIRNPAGAPTSEGRER